MTVIDLQAAAENSESRPYWQDRPCPAWCTYSDTHSDGDEPAIRSHQGPAVTVILTLEAPDVRWATEGETDEVEPAELEVRMVQHYRETGPRILVTHNEQPGFYLTPAEAAELASVLTAFARQGGA